MDPERNVIEDENKVSNNQSEKRKINVCKIVKDAVDFI